VGGKGVEIEIGILHVLAVVALGIGQAKEAFLKDRVEAVPKRGRETETAFAVGEAEQAVLAPAIRAAAGVIVREIIPAVAIRGIIFADGAPLPLREVGTPAFPVFDPTAVLIETLRLGAMIHGTNVKGDASIASVSG